MASAVSFPSRSGDSRRVITTPVETANAKAIAKNEPAQSEYRSAWGGREALDLDRAQWKEPKPQNLLCERIKEGVDALMTST